MKFPNRANMSRRNTTNSPEWHSITYLGCFTPPSLGLLPWGFNYILFVTSNGPETEFSSLMKAWKVGRVSHSGDSPAICHCRCPILQNGCDPKRWTLGWRTQVCDLSISRQKSDAVIPDLFVAAKELLLVTSDLFILRDGVISSLSKINNKKRCFFCAETED